MWLSPVLVLVFKEGIKNTAPLSSPFGSCVSPGPLAKPFTFLLKTPQHLEKLMEEDVLFVPGQRC